MSIRPILEMLVGLSILAAYIMLEKRINHRKCPECGKSASDRNPEETCRGCGALLK
jgi:rubrerythrin